MKCYKCGGTGVYDIYNDCPVCDGTGEYDPTDKGFGLPHDLENTVWDTDIYLDDLDGKEPMTNEEWLNSLNSTEKANWLEGTTFSCNVCTENRFEWYRKHEEHCPLHCACCKENGFELWLKEKHI